MQSQCGNIKVTKIYVYVALCKIHFVHIDFFTRFILYFGLFISKIDFITYMVGFQNMFYPTDIEIGIVTCTSPYTCI